MEKCRLHLRKCENKLKLFRKFLQGKRATIKEIVTVAPGQSQLQNRVSVFPTLQERMAYLMERRVSHRHSRSLDEMQQRKLLLHFYILVSLIYPDFISTASFPLSELFQKDLDLESSTLTRWRSGVAYESRHYYGDDVRRRRVNVLAETGSEWFNFTLSLSVSDSMLEELRACFMEAYDDNQDGKIDIREIWREYDTDGSGYIEADELKCNKNNLQFLFVIAAYRHSQLHRIHQRVAGLLGKNRISGQKENFLRDLLKEAKKINDVSEDKLIEYTDTMVQRPPTLSSPNFTAAEFRALYLPYLLVVFHFNCRQMRMRANRKQVLTATHGHSHLQNSHQYVADLLGKYGISDGGENTPPQLSFTGRNETAEAAT
ncbi:Calbindin-32 [Eumeta japonica]|uniref:Calbindin-32 n=1 Tax=Eumeta variegata TaxID=151549 RepID=A0A4C1VBV5_EUMVA|nr:Calbindin-32 [Eumeta japonica]